MSSAGSTTQPRQTHPAFRPTAPHAEEGGTAWPDLMRNDPEQAFAQLRNALVDPHRSLQDKRRFLERTATHPDSFFVVLASSNDAIWWMRVMGHGGSFGLMPLHLPLHDCVEAGVPAAQQSQAELPVDLVRWADRIDRYVAGAPDAPLGNDIAQSALAPQALLAILNRVSSRLPHLSAGTSLPDEAHRWLLLLRLALDRSAATSPEVSALTKQAIDAMSAAWARCVGAREEHGSDAADPAVRQAWVAAFVETALHERLLAQNLHPHNRRCLLTITSWGGGGGPSTEQSLTLLPQALGRTRCKAMAQMMVTMFMPWIRVGTPDTSAAQARLHIESFLRLALRHGHQQSIDQPLGRWGDWLPWLDNLSSPIEFSLDALSEEVRHSSLEQPATQPGAEPETPAPARAGAGVAAPGRTVGGKNARTTADPGTPPSSSVGVKRRRIQTSQAPTFDADAYAERLRRWLNGTDAKPPRPPVQASAWWVLNQALRQLPSPDRIGGDEWRDALGAVARWSGFFFQKLQTLSDGVAIPGAAVTLLDELWQHRLAPARHALAKSANIADPWPSLTKGQLALALHPRFLRGAPQAALTQCLGTWAPQMDLDSDSAMELLEQAVPAVDAQPDRLALVKALLPFALTWKQFPAPSRRLRVLLLTVLKDRSVRGPRADLWIAELKQLFGPMHLDADDALEVLMQCSALEKPAEVNGLTMWLWPFVHAVACKAGEDHPAWRWMTTCPATIGALRQLPTEQALTCLQILSAMDGQWARPGPFETAWCALFSHLRQRIDLIAQNRSKELQAVLQGLRTLFELHPVFQANPPQHVLDDIDWAVWEGVRGQALLDVITRQLERVTDLQQAKERLKSHKHLVAPASPQAPPSLQTMTQLLGPDLADELRRSLNDLVRSRTTRPPERSAPAVRTRSAFDDDVQAAQDALAETEIEQLIARGLNGEPLLREMLERHLAGGVSAVQMRRWAHTEYAGPAGEHCTMRAILGDFAYDVLQNVLTGI